MVRLLFLLTIRSGKRTFGFPLRFRMLKNAPGAIRTHGPRIRNPVLYPPELRGRIRNCLWFAIEALVTIRQGTRHGNFLPPFECDPRQITNPRCKLNNAIDSRLFGCVRPRLPDALTTLCAALLIVACNQTRPLSINMIHPITKEFRTCAARELNPKNTDALAATVELCAKHLESRGYIRDDG